MKVIIRGTGQLNGPKIINKELILEDKIALSLQGSKKDQVLKSIMDSHYPGVKYDSNQISINLLQEDKKKEKPSSIDDFTKGVVSAGIIASAVSNKSKNSSNKRKKVNNEGFRNEIEFLLDLDLYGSVEDIKRNLDKIYGTIKVYKWPLRSDEDELSKNNTKILNQIYEHYKIGIRNLKKQVVNNEEIEDFVKQFKKLKTKKIFNQYGLWIYVVMTILILLLLVAILE